MTALLWAVLALSPEQAEALGPAELPAVSQSYVISATLSDDLREVRGEVELTWAHPSLEPLRAVPVHLYLNAFSHSATTWMAEWGDRFDDRLQVYPDPWGWIELGEVEQPGAGACSIEYIRPDDGNPLDRTLASVRLAAPVPVGQELRLRLPFTARLPVPIARTGARSDYAHVAQWFPKLGMFDPPRRGQPGAWAARQFHGVTEFYAEFADYRVTVNVPEGFTLIAPGHAEPGASTFVLRAVHDFVFVVGKNLWVEAHTHQPKGDGQPVHLRYVVPTSARDQVQRMRLAAERTLDILGERIGPYPYPTLTLVQPPWHAAATAGMEYPTLVTGVPGDPLFTMGPLANLPVVEPVLVHEVIHNYFQGLVATNEQEQAFLDEGFTSYWSTVVMESLNAERQFRLGGWAMDVDRLDRQALAGDVADIDEPLVRRPAALFHPGTARTQIYQRGELLLQTAAAMFGQSEIGHLFAVYFKRHRFGHPTAEDFLAVAREVCPPRLADFLSESFTQVRWPDYRIESASTEPWTPPRGRIPGEQAPFVVSDNTFAQAEAEGVGLDPAAREADGRVTITVIDPGFALDAEVSDGRVLRSTLEPKRAAPASEPQPDTFFASSVRLRGSGWRNLPVSVRFRWDDGVEIVQRWDGLAPWREFRFLRPSPLVEVQIDPDDQIKLDVDRKNNAWRRDPDKRFVNRWSAWFSQTLQWLLLLTGAGL